MSVQQHRESHERRGNTLAVYFPPECPWETYLQVTDAIAKLAFDVDREAWDAFVFGCGGDCELVPVDGGDRVQGSLRKRLRAAMHR